MIRPAHSRVVTRGVRAGAAGLSAVLVSTLLSVALVGTPAGGVEEETGEEGDAASAAAPLAVTIRTLTPAVLPRRGTVTLTGSITNRSESTWTDLDVYLFMSEQPITGSDDLAEATGTAAEVDVGPRITRAGLYDEVGDLEPGESTDYFLTVPVAELPAEDEGVYWMGVHVLGTNEEGRIEGADGRARTFIPLVRGQQPRTTLSLVVPVKSPVTRRRDGRLGNAASLSKHLAAEGRLTRLLELSDTRADVPLTWVVDPALLDAAASLAAGDPPFDVRPTAQGDEPASPPSSPGPGADAGGGEDPDPATGELTDEAREADAWLEEFTAQAPEHAVMTVPYGDLDVASVLRRDHEHLFERGAALSADTMERLGVRGNPIVAPPDGRLPNAALTSLDTSATLLLDAGAVDTDDRVVRLREGHLVVRASQVARVGGPTPTEPYGALALRQRILAEAAVHALTDDPTQPLVVTTPETWDPGAAWRSAAFFAALDQPWLRTVNLPFAVALAPGTAYQGRLGYPRVLRRGELPEQNLTAVRDLDEAGSVLSNLLARNDSIDDQVGRAALLGGSFNARPHPARALARSRRTTDSVQDQLEQVYVESSPLVTMSSETGNFSVTVVNGLEQPVTVGLDAQTGTPDLEISSPDLVSLGPGQRASVRLAVTATDTGVHSVEIIPTTEDGRPLGRVTRIKVRSSQVGLVIWLIMGGGAVVFVAAIAARIVRRVRERKRTHGPVLKESAP